MPSQYTEDMTPLEVASKKLKLLEGLVNDVYSVADFLDSVTFNKEDNYPGTGYPYSFRFAYAQALQRPSATACAYITEPQLRLIRAASRAFCIANPPWMAVRENKINYAVGTGHVVSIVPRRKGVKVKDKLAWDVQDEIEQFCKANQYRRRQGEKLTRLDRDGEYFLWFQDRADDGILHCRFLEPLLLQDPPGYGIEGGVVFGIKFEDNDYERPVRYYFKNADYQGGMSKDQQSTWHKGIPAGRIQHRKANVDLGSPRGLPTPYILMEPCLQAVSTRKSMGRLVDIRARIALIRKQVNATAAQIDTLALRNRAKPATGIGGVAMNAFQIPYGTIFDTNDQRRYELPAQNLEVDQIVNSLKTDLQAVAAAIGMADFTLSADGRSAFSNSLCKEGPMDRAIGRLQADMMDDDIEVYERALTVAANNDRLPPDVLSIVKLSIDPPGVVARERLQSTQADEIVWRCGGMSSATMSRRAGLDYDDEKHQGAKVQVKGTQSKEAPKSGGAAGRGVPGGSEPGPGANKGNVTKEECERLRQVWLADPTADNQRALVEAENESESFMESSHEPHAQAKPTKEDMDMASVFLTDEWLAKTRTEILGLQASGTCPRDSGMRVEYEPGVRAVLLGTVAGKQVYAVDADAVMILHSCSDFCCAGNHARWPWIPDNVMLVDWAYSPVDMQHDIYHEAIEVRCMTLGKWSYARAHLMASYLETAWMLQLRPELQPLADSAKTAIASQS